MVFRRSFLKLNKAAFNAHTESATAVFRRQRLEELENRVASISKLHLKNKSSVVSTSIPTLDGNTQLDINDIPEDKNVIEEGEKNKYMIQKPISAADLHRQQRLERVAANANRKLFTNIDDFNNKTNSNRNNRGFTMNIGKEHFTNNSQNKTDNKTYNTYASINTNDDKWKLFGVLLAGGIAAELLVFCAREKHDIHELPPKKLFELYGFVWEKRLDQITKVFSL